MRTIITNNCSGQPIRPETTKVGVSSGQYVFAHECLRLCHRHALRARWVCSTVVVIVVSGINIPKYLYIYAPHIYTACFFVVHANQTPHSFKPPLCKYTHLSIYPQPQLSTPGPGLKYLSRTSALRRKVDPSCGMVRGAPYHLGACATPRTCPTTPS